MYFYKIAINIHFDIPEQSRNEQYLVFFLNNLAFCLYITGEKDEALKFQKKALQIVLKSSFGNTTALHSTIKLLSSMYNDIGDTENAEKTEALLNNYK